MENMENLTELKEKWFLEFKRLNNEVGDIYHPNKYAFNLVINDWNNAKNTKIWDKNSLIDILKGHPNYRENEFMVVKEIEFPFELDVDAIYQINNDIKYLFNDIIQILEKQNNLYPWNCVDLNDICSKLDSKIYHAERLNFYINNSILAEKIKEWREDYKKFNKYRQNQISINISVKEKYDKIKNIILDTLKEKTYSGKIEITDSDVNLWSNNLGINLQKTQKLSKVIAKELNKIKIADKDIISRKEQICARLGEVLNAKPKKYIMVVSANPIDYLTMSYSKNIVSCYTIDKQNNGRSSYNDTSNQHRGCCSSGTVSYMSDCHTVITYLLKKDSDNCPMEDKIKRCCFHIGQDKIIMGRIYPQNRDGVTAEYKAWRESVQTIISECLNINNFWKTYKEKKEYEYDWENSDIGYNDLDCSYTGIAGYSYHDNKPKNDIRIILGVRPRCLSCGEMNYYTDAIECEYCYNETNRCACCGEEINTHNAIEINGRYYCRDCVFYCNYHNEYEVIANTDVYYIKNYGDICDGAFNYSTDFYYCETCGNYYHINDFNLEENRCNDCFEE